jgi:hypothetical protein
LVTGIDSASLFHDLVPGADAPASSVVAILAAADAIATWRKKDASHTLEKVIGFGLFQGEAWDSIGSRRFVYDIARYGAADSCNNSVAAAESPTGREMCLSPLLPSVAFQGLGAGLENLDAVVAVDQVGRGATEDLFWHTDAQDADVPKVDIQSAPRGAKLPPSPLDSFRLRKPAVAGYVLAGYNKNFSNKYYHSQYDNFSTPAAVNASVLKILAAANKLSRSLVWLANPSKKAGGPPKEDDLPVNPTLVRDLLTCIIGNWQCDLFNKYLASTYANLDHYLGVNDLRFDPSAPSLDPRKPSLYTTVASIKTIPPTLPYVTLTVQDVPNFVFALPKCANGQDVTPDKELCMLCDEPDCTLKSKKALMQNIHVVTFPKNVYEGFLRSFLVAKTTNNRTTVGCNATADCRHLAAGDFECHNKTCIEPR